jgi:hypothetical protein
MHLSGFFKTEAIEAIDKEEVLDAIIQVSLT